MSLSKEHSHDKADFVKWPHLETHWQPQHYETRHHAHKKADNLRSHSWWWDSHISPKSSKWLQENLSEMDSKVNAMLRIIEEDADSFAKRAEMYYKRRPELVSLVEEFYRTYRALVERHTFLTKELRQNIAPALQAHFSGAAPSNIPGNSLVTQSSDGLDIAHLSPFSFPGALDFGDDGQSAQPSKGQMEEEDDSSQNSSVRSETHEYDFQPFPPLSPKEEHLQLQHLNRESDGFVDTYSSVELRKTIQLLEDEKKALTAKSGEGEVRLKHFESEVSSLLSKTKALEAEEKLAKDRVNELLHLKQSLEAENLKLNHALITSKEEKTQLIEAQDQNLNEMLASTKRKYELEEEIMLLQQKMAASHAEVLLGQELTKKLKDECNQLQYSLDVAQEGNQKEAITLKETFERHIEGLQKQISDLEEENGYHREQSTVQTVKLQELEQQIMKIDGTRTQLEQDLLKSQKLKEALELEGSKLVLNIEELRREVDASQRSKQELSEQVMQKGGQVSKLEETIADVQAHRTRLEAEKDEMLKHALRLEAESKELQEARNGFLAESQHYKSQCEAQEATEVLLKEQLASLSNKNSELMDQKDLLEKQGREALHSNSRLKEELSLLETERVERSKLVERLCADVEELKNAKDHSHVRCQQSEEECRALKVAEEGLRALLAAKVSEGLSLQNDKAGLKGELAKVCLQMEELQANVSTLSPENAALRLELGEALEQVRVTNAMCLQWQAKSEECQAEIEMLQNEAAAKVESIFKLENEINSQSMGIAKLEEKIVLLGNEKENDIRTMAVYEGKVHDLETKVSESLAAQTALNEQVAQKSLEIRSLEVELVGVCKGKDALSEKLAACSAHAMLLQNQLDKSKELEDVQHEDLQRCADMIRSMKMEAESLQLTVSRAEERNNALICEQQKSLDEICGMSRRIQDLEEQVRYLTEDKALLTKDHEEQKGRLQMQLQSSKDMIQSLEVKLLELHAAAIPSTEEHNSIPVCQQSRSFDAGLSMSDRITQIHHRVGSLLEERALLASKVSHHKEQRDEMELRLQSLERDKGAMEEERKKEQQEVLEARRNIEELRGDLSQLKQAHAMVQNELSTKVMELSSAQEDVSKVAARNDLLEVEAQQHLHQIEVLNEDVEKLRHQHENARQEIKGLEEHSSQLAIKCSDFEKAICKATEEISKHVADGDSLRHQVAVLLTDVRKLEEDVTSVKEEKKGLLCKMEVLQQELEGAQRGKENLMLQMKDRISEKVVEIENLQEQLKAANSGQISLAESLSEAKNQWSAEQGRLQEELAQLKGTSLEGEKNLVVQLESVGKLKTELLLVRQENSRLEEHLSQVVSKHMDAEQASLEAKEELKRHITSRDLLNSEMAVALSNARKLGHDRAAVQDENRSLLENLDSSQFEMAGVRDANGCLMSQVKEVMLQLQAKDSEIGRLQEQLHAVESHSSSLKEDLSSMRISWGVEQERLQGELAQLKATNIEGQRDLAIQLDCVSKLKDELSLLHGERSLLQKDRDLGAEQLAEHLNQMEAARQREYKKDAELLEFSALVETLKQSLLTRDLESSKLREDLRISAECQSDSENRFMDEIAYLQREELKWRNEVTTNSALMAEKVASLRMENAALHEDLSLKLELLLKLQKDVESLTEERSNLSEALHAMAAEMQEYKNDLEFFKEEVIPGLEERAGELQQEIIDLTISNERHVIEIGSLQKELKDAMGELLHLHDENAMLKVELMFNVGMLQHLGGAFSAVKVERAKLFDELGLQGKHSQMQEQNLMKALYENDDLRRRMLTIMEERDGLRREVQNLIVLFVQLEQLQSELAAGRRDNSSGRGAESLNMETVISTSDRGSVVANDPTNNEMHDAWAIQSMPKNVEDSVRAQMCQDLEHGENMVEPKRQMKGSPLAGLQGAGNFGSAKDGTDAKSTASASLHALYLIERLKDEILYIQEEIQRLRLESASQGAGFASKETASSSSILTIEEDQVRWDVVQKLKEENCNLVEEINSLKSQSLATWMENAVVENSLRDLQARLAHLQELNGHLCSEVSSCKEEIGRLEGECHSLHEKNGHLALEVSSGEADRERLGGECHSLQEKIAQLQQDLMAFAEKERKSEETQYMLENVITELEHNNRHLQSENESRSMEVNKLQSAISILHADVSELIAVMKTKMTAVLEEVKLVLDECRKEIGEEGIMQAMIMEPLCSSPHRHVSASLPEDKHANVTVSADPREALEAMTELEAQNMFILTELQARAEETNILLVFVVFIRQMLLKFLSGEHTNLAEHLHQASMDDRIEHELVELKEGRKQLKEDLEARLAEVQRMESELENYQLLLEIKKEHEKGEEGKRRENARAEESAKELREMLAQQKRQIGRVQEEIIFREEQQEATAENQVTILVRKESAPSMEGGDDEQVDLISRELESLRVLHRRHSAELQTISQDLQSLGSIIKAAQEQLLVGSPEHREEIESMADLRTHNSIIDLRTQDNRVSIDSTQQLLSPSLRIEGEMDSVTAHQSSDSGIGHFPLKPRNFGFTWFLLLFSPERKAVGLARSKSDKRWGALKPIRRSGSNSAAMAMESGRRRTASCWSCVSKLDSFDYR